MIKSLAMFAVALSATYAVADDGRALPDNHLSDKCHAQSKSISGSSSSAISEECLKSEQAAYDDLKKHWPKLDEGQKTKCIAASAPQKLGNYRILQQCMARDVLRVDGQIKDNPTGKVVGK